MKRNTKATGPPIVACPPHIKAGLHCQSHCYSSSEGAWRRVRNGSSLHLLHPVSSFPFFCFSQFLHKLLSKSTVHSRNVRHVLVSMPCPSADSVVSQGVPHVVVTNMRRKTVREACVTQEEDGGRSIVHLKLSPRVIYTFYNRHIRTNKFKRFSKHSVKQYMFRASHKENY